MPQSVPCGPRTFIWMLFDHWWTAERHTSFLSQPIGNALWNAYESHYISKSRGETDTENVLKLEIQEWYKYFQVPFDGQLTYFKPCSLMSHLKNRNVELPIGSDCTFCKETFCFLLHEGVVADDGFELLFIWESLSLVQRKALAEVWYVNWWEWWCWQWVAGPLTHCPSSSITPWNPIFENR